MDNKWDCITSGGLWTSHVSGFNDLPAAMVTIFHMSTTAGWAEVMYNGIDSRGEDLLSERLNRRYYGIYFVLIILLSAFFIANLFIGVVINTYNNQLDYYDGNFLLSENQRRWLKVSTLIFQSSPVPNIQEPKN